MNIVYTYILKLIYIISNIFPEPSERKVHTYDHLN